MPYADLGRAEVYYEDDGSGPPVILLNGLGASAAFWGDAVEIMSPGFRLIRPDNRGAGRTRYSGRFGMGDMAGDAVRLMDFLGLERAGLVGWSLGSNIAQAVAVAHPERVGALALVSSYCRRPARASFFLRSMSEAMAGGMPPERFGAALSAMCFSDGFFEKREREGAPVPVPEITDAQGVAMQLESAEEFDSRESARLISAPTLCVHGSEDAMVGLRYGEDLAGRIPGCELLVVEGAGHSVPQKAYIPAVAEFMRRHPWT
ncbi:MAG: alpha/beta hydrolase [Candidatus Methanoplasma sp.]|jgi:pimeloyl-ACP methyl ester carboxylesterase|nr:alpha/beta hydrolase [Candidatus Methanoplasma sp.]